MKGKLNQCVYFFDKLGLLTAQMIFKKFIVTYFFQIFKLDEKLKTYSAWGAHN